MKISRINKIFNINKIFKIFLLNFLGILAGCCSSSSTHYYLLEPIPDCQNHQQKSSNLRIGIAPIKIADYLKRKSVVQRTMSSEIKLSRFNYWGSQLEKNIAEVLEQNLSVILNTDYIFLAPEYKNIRVDRILYVEILQFDTCNLRCSKLVAKWQAFDNCGKLLSNHRSCYITPTVKHNYASSVTAMSKNLRDLALEIGQTLQ